MKHRHPNMLYNLGVDHIIDSEINHYHKVFKDFVYKEDRPKYFINLDNWVDNQEEGLKNLCNALEIEYSPDFLNFSNETENIHVLASNSFAHRQRYDDKGIDSLCDKTGVKADWYKQKRGQLKKDERWKTEFTEAQRNRILNNKKVSEIRDILAKAEVHII